MNVTFYGKRDFAEVIKLRILRYGDYPGLSGCALNVIVKCPHKREAEGELTRSEGHVMETESERSYAVGFEDG